MAIDKIGKFTVLSTLGSGAHSSILRVLREADGKEYALKQVSIDDDDHKKYYDQAKHEYRVGKMFNHPSLVKVYCFETDSDWLFRPKRARLLIEYVNGKTLDQVSLIKMHKLLRVLELTADGLVHMHKHGVIHADLKPNNIMLGRGKQVKTNHYGLSWIKSEPKDRIQGTPEYLAPETIKSKLINERTDIFNFGATMYRLVTFQYPPAVMEMMKEGRLDDRTYKALYKPVEQLNAAAPKELCALIRRCLSFNALERPERMSEVQSVLDQLADVFEARVDPSELDEE